MTLHRALDAAGTHALPVGRPGSPVAHVYLGPLTPSGRLVPRAGRAACKTHTRRLHVLERLGPLDPDVRRVCLRCAALLLNPPESGSAAQLTTRTDWQTTYADLTPFDLAVDAFMATTVEEVERVEFLAMLLVGWPTLHTTPVVSPAGKSTGPLGRHLRRARTRVGGTQAARVELAARLDEASADAAEARKRTAREAWQEKEDRIARLGYVNATA